MPNQFNHFSVRKPSRVVGPIAVFLGAADKVLKLLGVAGASDDAKGWAEMLNNPQFLQWVLIVSGLVLVFYGYREVFQRILVWGQWQYVMWRFRLAKPGTDRLFAAQGIADHFINRCDWLTDSDDYRASVTMFDQLENHAKKSVNRVVVSERRASWNTFVLAGFRLLQECKKILLEQGKDDLGMQPGGSKEALKELRDGFLEFREKLPEAAIRRD